MKTISITLDHNDAVLLYGSIAIEEFVFREAGNELMARIYGDLSAKLYAATGGRSLPREKASQTDR